MFFGATAADFIDAHFYVRNAERNVVAVTAAIRNQDPCGDVLSYFGSVATNLAHVDEIAVPAFVAIGGRDNIYPVGATTQAALLTGSDDVSTLTLPNTGHAITLHLTADAFQDAVSQWLTSEGFGG